MNTNNTQETQVLSKSTIHFFGWGTLGRDMCYTLINTCLLYFFINALGMGEQALWIIGIFMTIARVWDALNDPIMGTIIDNTHSKYGKFKPWITIGALSNAIIVILLFLNLGNSSKAAIIYGSLYILWGMTYTMNDISYWSMLPALSTNSSERAQLGSIANIAVSIGMFSIIAAFKPIVFSIAQFLGTGTSGQDLSKAFFILALCVCIIFLISTALTIFGVKQKQNSITSASNKKSSWKNSIRAIIKNDQLLVIAVVYLLFNIGYYTTTSLGIYYFDFIMHDYGIGSRFLIFAIVLAVGQISAIALYPALSKKLKKRTLFTYAICFITVGYLGLFLAGVLLPLNMITLGLSGMFLFFGTSTITMIIQMIFADTVEYGQLKLGTRNESAVFSLRPFCVKLASAFQALITTAALIFSHLNKVSKNLSEIPMEGDNSQYLSHVGVILNSIENWQYMVLRIAMTVFPVILIIISYVIFIKFFKLDEENYKEIIKQLEEKSKNT